MANLHNFPNEEISRKELIQQAESARRILSARWVPKAIQSHPEQMSNGIGNGNKAARPLGW